MRAPLTIGADGRPRLQPRSLTGMPSTATKSNLRLLQLLDDVNDLVFVRNSLPAPRLLTARLQAAVLEDAFWLLARPRVHERSDWAAAVWWVQGNGQSPPNFAFADVCSNLGLDVHLWRSELLAIATDVHRTLGTDAHRDPRNRRAKKQTRDRLPRIEAPKRRKRAA